MSYNDRVDFNTIIGKTFTEIKGMEAASEQIDFKCSDGSIYRMLHYSDCCEEVHLEDVCGNVEDLLNTPITQAEEASSANEGTKPSEFSDSWTWTFYRIATAKGSVQLRWLGESNGYYSESVDFEKINQEG